LRVCINFGVNLTMTGGLQLIMETVWYLISRIDNFTHAILDHVHVHDKFSDSLKVRLNWLKNMNNERDAPFQIVLGSMNHIYCILWTLALWLELIIKLYPPAIESPYPFCFCCEFRIPEGGKRQRQ
jgi:hypothetical protein